MSEFLDDIINDNIDGATEKFNDIMMGKVADIVSLKRDEISSTLFNPPAETNTEPSEE
jgi:hypothetical protein